MPSRMSSSEPEISTASARPCAGREHRVLASLDDEPWAGDLAEAPAPWRAGVDLERLRGAGADLDRPIDDALDQRTRADLVESRGVESLGLASSGEDPYVPRKSAMRLDALTAAVLRRGPDIERLSAPPLGAAPQRAFQQRTHSPRGPAGGSLGSRGDRQSGRHSSDSGLTGVPNSAAEGRDARLRPNDAGAWPPEATQLTIRPASEKGGPGRIDHGPVHLRTSSE
jgi:hypothetical protein